MFEDLDSFYETLLKYGIDKIAFEESTKTLNVDNLLLTKIDTKDLENLNIIENINGDLTIDGSIVKELNCFCRLTQVKTLSIINSNRLKSIVGFNSLLSLESLIIDNNPKLNEIFGFNKLFFTTANIKSAIKIINNISLRSISFLRGLKSVKSSFYLHNNGLIDLKGLENLEKVSASLSLSYNNLNDLNELKNLKYVNGMLGVESNQLVSLDGLENLEHLKTTDWNGDPRTIAIGKNSNLKDISAIQNICEVNNNCIVLMDEKQEFQILPNKGSVFSYNNIRVYYCSTKKELDRAVICGTAPNCKNHYIDINHEFALDDDWRPGLNFYDYATLRGRKGMGVQLERVDLIRWNDKIYNYHFLKQHGIGTMPIIMYSQRQNDDFFDKLRDKYAQGLTSFVLKASHLSNSDGIFRVKDGKFISINESRSGGKLYGKPVDFDYLEKEFESIWQHKAYGEEWACWMLSPGIILEELIEDSVEFNFSVVFGELAGFFLKIKGKPTFDAEGNLLSKNKGILPYWWKDARELAIRVARLVKADQIRIDIFKHKNKLVVNEITWNGGERYEYHPNIIRILDEGYSYRLKMLGKKHVDVKNDEYVKKLLKHKEFIALSVKNDFFEENSIVECKFLIVDVDNENPKFYWLNTKKHTDYYQFYEKVLGYNCSRSEFNQITYNNEIRKNIAGSVIYSKNPIMVDKEKYHYSVKFSPIDSITFEYISMVYTMVEQRAIFVKDSIVVHLLSFAQQKNLNDQKRQFKQNGIKFIDKLNIDEIDEILVGQSILIEGEQNNIGDYDTIDTINGDLVIKSTNEKKLNGFHQLKKIEGTLCISDNDHLEEINGFDSLEYAKNIEISYNNNLKDILAFSKLFSKIKKIQGYIKVVNNKNLKSIEFFHGLESVRSSFYLHHNALESLNGLENLCYVGASLSLSSNKLTALESLSNLKDVDGMLGVAYNNLTTLKGLEKLEKISVAKWGDEYRSITIKGNKKLHDISAMSNMKSDTGYLMLQLDKESDFQIIPEQSSIFYNQEIVIFDGNQELETSLYIPHYKKPYSVKFLFDYKLNWEAVCRKKTWLKSYFLELMELDEKPRILFGDKWQKMTAKCDWMNPYHIYFDEVEKIISYCNIHNIQVLFGNNYRTQKIILNNTESLKTKGLKFIVNSRRTLKRLVDKQLFYNVMVESGFGENVPVYYTSRSEIVYPCMVKPYSGGAGRGVYIANAYDEIVETGKQMIISEYLPGNTEYASSVFYKDGRILHHKTYSKKANKTHFVLQQESNSSIKTTAVMTPFLELFRNIVEAFHGEEGYCLCSMNYKIVDGVLKLFEINPRTGYTLAQHPDDFKEMIQIYLDELEVDSKYLTKHMRPVLSYLDMREHSQQFIETKHPKQSNMTILVYQNWRVFYTLKGKSAPLDVIDSSKSGIPDYIELMLYKFETAKRLLIESFGLRDPLKGGFFYDNGAKFIDIYIKDIPREHGIASGVVYDEEFESLKNTLYQGKSLKITIHRNLIKKTATPIHELFHLFQYSYTHFNNMWFMEGLARWSQSIMQEKTGKEESLPQNEAELDTLVHKFHDAEFFWNRLVTLCEDEDTFTIPKDLEHNTEIYNNKKTGVTFIKVLLEQCEIQYKLMEKTLKTRQIKNATYWARHDKRTANNNQYIFKAIINAVEMTRVAKNDELSNFLDLIRPLADIFVEDYNTQEIQTFLKVIKKYAKTFVLESETGVLYSEFFDVFTQTFSCKELDLTDSEISDSELDSFEVIKSINGGLIIKNCKNLTSLHGLSNIRSIERDLIISGLDIKELNALNGLISVNQLQIFYMDKLESISGLNSLERIRSKLIIFNCMKLNVISGLDRLVDLGNIEISRTSLTQCDFLRNIFIDQNYFKGAIKLTYNALDNIRFMEGITEVKSSFFLHHNALETLEGLEQLKHIGGSLSLSANKLHDLTALRSLESINGVLSLTYNNLVTLDGLENLRSLVTKKWSNTYFTMKFYGNSALKDISALSGIMTKDNYMVIYFDDINYLKKPNVDSDFHRNILELHDFKTAKLIPTYKFVNKKEHNYDNFSKATHNKLLNTLFDFEIKDANVLVLSFTGAYGNLGGLFYNKHALIIDEMNTHKIFMMDPTHTWYNRGVPPFSKNMDENIQFIKELILAKKYKKVVCMGASMGAYFSLLLGCVLENYVDDVLAFTPQIFLDDVNRLQFQDSRWRSLIKQFPNDIKEEYLDLKKLFEKYQNHTTRFMIHYASKHMVDSHHVHHLNLQDNITLVPYNVDNHYLTVMLHKENRLKPIILDVLRRDLCLI